MQDVFRFLSLVEALRGFPVQMAWLQDVPSAGWGKRGEPAYYPIKGFATPNTIPGEGPYRVTHFLDKEDQPSGHFTLTPEEFDQLAAGASLEKGSWLVKRSQ